MAWHLAECAAGRIKRLLITMPPRHLKSICASVAFPAWVLGRNPSKRIVCVSYAADLAVKLSRDCRLAMAYKVYIIDEVHMLSKQAFNGLLKTLEEPPPHVKFVFATTEIRKVPVTVLSRCQRFDLRRIDSAELAAYLATLRGKGECEDRGRRAGADRPRRRRLGPRRALAAGSGDRAW